MKFASIPLRSNDSDILAEWFNLLRMAGIELDARASSLETFMGPSGLSGARATIANNQATPQNVTGLVLDSTKYRSAIIFAEVTRRSDSVDIISAGTLKAFARKDGLWDESVVDEIAGDDDGCDFTVTTAGQVQYVSNNVVGADYVGSICFKVLSFAI